MFIFACIISFSNICERNVMIIHCCIVIAWMKISSGILALDQYYIYICVSLHLYTIILKEL